MFSSLGFAVLAVTYGVASGQLTYTNFFFKSTQDTNLTCATAHPAFPTRHDTCPPCFEESTRCSFVRFDFEPSSLFSSESDGLLLIIVALILVPGCCVFYCARFCCDGFGGRWPNHGGFFGRSERAVSDQDMVKIPIEARPGRVYTYHEVMCARVTGIVASALLLTVPLCQIFSSFKLSSTIEKFVNNLIDLLLGIHVDAARIASDLLASINLSDFLSATIGTPDVSINDYVSRILDVVSFTRGLMDGFGVSIIKFSFSAIATTSILVAIAVILIVAVPGVVAAAARVNRILPHVAAVLAAIILSAYIWAGVAITPLPTLSDTVCRELRHVVDPPLDYVHPLDGILSVWEGLDRTTLPIIDSGFLPFMMSKAAVSIADTLAPELANRTTTTTAAATPAITTPSATGTDLVPLTSPTLIAPTAPPAAADPVLNYTGYYFDGLVPLRVASINTTAATLTVAIGALRVVDTAQPGVQASLVECLAGAAPCACAGTPPGAPRSLMAAGIGAAVGAAGGPPSKKIPSAPAASGGTCEAAVRAAGLTLQLLDVRTRVRATVVKELTGTGTLSLSAVRRRVWPLVKECDGVTSALEWAVRSLWCAGIFGVLFMVIMWIGNKRFVEPGIRWMKDGASYDESSERARTFHRIPSAGDDEDAGGVPLRSGRVLSPAGPVSSYSSAPPRRFDNASAAVGGGGGGVGGAGTLRAAGGVELQTFGAAGGPGGAGHYNPYATGGHANSAGYPYSAPPHPGAYVPVPTAALGGGGGGPPQGGDHGAGYPAHGAEGYQRGAIFVPGQPLGLAVNAPAAHLQAQQQQQQYAKAAPPLVAPYAEPQSAAPLAPPTSSPPPIGLGAQSSPPAAPAAAYGAHATRSSQPLASHWAPGGGVGMPNQTPYK